MNKRKINNEFIIRLSMFTDGKRVNSRLVGFDTLYWTIGNHKRFMSIITKAWYSGKENYKKKLHGNYYVEFISRK